MPCSLYTDLGTRPTIQLLIDLIYSCQSKKNLESLLYVQCLAAVLRLPVHQTENNFLGLKRAFADEINVTFFRKDLDWRSFIKINFNEVGKLRCVLNFIYPLLLRPNFPSAVVGVISENISLLIDLMTGSEDSIQELDEESLFELLEIGLYVIYLLTNREKEIILSSVAGSLMPLGHIQYKGKLPLVIHVIYFKKEAINLP